MNLIEYIKEKKLGKYILGSGIVICGVVCFVSGCFSNNNSNIEVAKPLLVQERQKSYDELADAWNRSVISLNLPSRYRIKDRTNVKEIANLFNSILNKIPSPSEFKNKYKCELNYEGDIFLPTKEYFKFFQPTKIVRQRLQFIAGKIKFLQ